MALSFKFVQIDPRKFYQGFEGLTNGTSMQFFGLFEEFYICILSPFKSLTSTIGIKQWLQSLNKKYKAKLDVSMSFRTIGSYQTKAKPTRISMHFTCV